MYSNPKHMSPVIPRPYITNPENNASPKPPPKDYAGRPVSGVVILFSHHSYALRRTSITTGQTGRLIYQRCSAARLVDEQL